MATDNLKQEKEIIVPPQLIGVLKNYTKAVVRAKPKDLFQWSAVYFRNLANGCSQDRKERLYIFDPAAGGLSQAVIRLIYLKLKEKETKRTVTVADLTNLWKELGLDSSLLLELFTKAGVPHKEEEIEVNWIKILALATAMTSEDLKDTMKKFLEVTGDNMSKLGMSFSTVKEVIQFLSEADDVPSSSVEHILQYLRDKGEERGGFITSSDFQDPTFPSM